MATFTHTLEVRTIPTAPGRCLRIGGWRNERGETRHIAIVEGYEADVETWTRTSTAAIEIAPEHAEAVARSLLELAGPAMAKSAGRR